MNPRLRNYYAARRVYLDAPWDNNTREWNRLLTATNALTDRDRDFVEHNAQSVREVQEDC